MFKKQVKCRNCGFLALEGAKTHTGATLQQMALLMQARAFESMECLQQGRDRIADGTHPDVSIFRCTRHVWGQSDFRDKPADAVLQFLNSIRKCPYFFPYHPGYSPTEHKELQREDRNRRILIVGMLLAAVIGAGAAVIAQVFAD